MTGTIYAIEGPAGAGKDYYVDNAKFDGLKLKRNINWPRNPGPNFGSYMSSTSDYNAIAWAMMMDKDVMVNRFMLSRFVYMACEQQIYPESYAWDMFFQVAVCGINRSFQTLVDAVANDYYTRIGLVYTGAMPRVNMTVILPTIDVLMARRRKAEKEYAWDAATEILLYAELVHALTPVLDITIRNH